MLSVGAVLLGGWLLFATGGVVWGAVTGLTAERQVHRVRAASERMNADLQARLDSAVARMAATSGSIDDLANTVERRHAAIDRSRSRRHRCAGHPMRRGDGRRHRGFARALLGAGSVAW